MADKYTNDELREILRKSASSRDQISDRSSYKTAVNYLQGKMADDIEAEINERYVNAQSATRGEKIKTITLPLIDKYVADSATIYNRPVTRELLDESGEVNEDATTVLQDTLRDSGFDQRMQQADKMVSVMNCCGVWIQSRRKNIIPRAITPNVTWPILDPMIPYPDKTDPHDYLGYVVQLSEANESWSGNNQYVLITPAEHIYYEGKSYSEFDADAMVRYDNPDKWTVQYDKRVDGIPTGDTEERDDALQMIVQFYGKSPVNSLLIDSDMDLVTLTREISIAWSVLVHIIRTQGHSQLLLNLQNPNSQPSRINYGPLHALVVDETESASYITAANNYTETVEALKALQQLFAVARSMSPSEFALSGAAPMSGFAKLIDSLPKLEARAERVERFRRTEEQQLWPRIGATMKRLGILPDAEKYKYRVTFSGLDFPRQVDEVIREAEFKYKHGLSSPARDLAKSEGLSQEEAEARIDKDKQKENNGGSNPTGFGQFVARRNRQNGGDTGKRGEEPRGNQGGGKGE